MSNEKILIIELGRTYDPAVIAGFIEHGWTIEHDHPTEAELANYRSVLESPWVAEFMAHVDRTGTISDDQLHAMREEVDHIKASFASPESFSKVTSFMIPLDFSDNVSHEDMERFLKEIDNGEEN